MEGKIRDRWKYGPTIDKEKEIDTCPVPYNELSEADRDFVGGIPTILAVDGYRIETVTDDGFIDAGRTHGYIRGEDKTPS